MEITFAKVRGYHLDLYAHVNNARYLEFLEEGRWAYFENRMNRDDIHSKGLGMVVVNNNINYRYPAKLHDILEIRTEIEKIGSKSIIFNQEIYLKEENTLVIDAKVIFVILDMKTGKAVEIDEKLRKYLSQ